LEELKESGDCAKPAAAVGPSGPRRVFFRNGEGDWNWKEEPTATGAATVAADFPFPLLEPEEGNSVVLALTKELLLEL
jgi:hypothetical protein